MQLFWQVLYGPQKPASKTASSLTQTEAPVETQEIVLIPVNSSNEQLLQMMVFDRDDKGQLKRDYENRQNRSINSQINDQLGHQIHRTFSQHANGGEDQVATALAPLFALAKNDTNRFLALVDLVIWKSKYVPRFTAVVLEKIEWPSEALKNEKLPAYLSQYILTNCLNWQDEYIEIELPSSSKESTFFHAYKLIVVTKRIFGHDDFVKNPKNLSPFLAQGMGMAFQKSAAAALEELKQKHEKGETDAKINMGLSLHIGQFTECRFPCSMLAPVLPYLKKIPGLVGLEIVDVGGSRSKHAFRDEDAPALLDIFKTNPHLFHIKINVGGMTKEIRKKFLEEWLTIMTTRKKGASIEGLIAIEAPKEST